MEGVVRVSSESGCILMVSRNVPEPNRRRCGGLFGEVELKSSVLQGTWFSLRRTSLLVTLEHQPEFEC